MTPTQSKTPRTDALMSTMIGCDFKLLADFARQLETELSKAREECELRKFEGFNSPELLELVKETAQLRKVCDELTERLSISDNHILQNIGKTTAHDKNAEALANYNQLPHVIKQKESKE